MTCLLVPQHWLLLLALQTCGLSFVHGWKQKPSAASQTQVNRPAHVVEALSKGESLYYFGVGSNLLRSKVENRGPNGSKIDLISMEPALVKNHRLAFNMRGFPPLEPGMGSLEPLVDVEPGARETSFSTSGSSSRGRSTPLLAFERPECHGSLILLSPENYEKLMASEGVSFNATNPGYEEIVVDAYPYSQGEGGQRPVKAVGLRARPHVRLRRDPAPSARYMQLLRQGAADLGLDATYQAFLAQHPTQQVPLWLRWIAIHNLVFTIATSSVLQTRLLSRVQSWLLFRVYNPAVQSGPAKGIHDAALALVLLPGTLAGGMIRLCLATWWREGALYTRIQRFLQVFSSESK